LNVDFVMNYFLEDIWMVSHLGLTVMFFTCCVFELTPDGEHILWKILNNVYVSLCGIVGIYLITY